jgi:hypothetical protein
MDSNNAVGESKPAPLRTLRLEFSELPALQAAIYILKLFAAGFSEKYVLSQFDTDEKKLVLTWIETLKDVNCLKVNESGNWVLSETGRTWI